MNTEETIEQRLIFSLYEQLPEPYQSQAKANYNSDFNKIIGETPYTIADALMLGFDFTETSGVDQGYNYWVNVVDELSNGTFDFKNEKEEKSDTSDEELMPEFLDLQVTNNSLLDEIENNKNKINQLKEIIDFLQEGENELKEALAISKYNAKYFELKW